VRVWDLPVRLFHWFIMSLVAFSWLTASKGWLGWHRFSGCAILSLVLFRIYWGLCGSSTARFAHFLRNPNAVGRYVRTLQSRDSQHAYFGHNPLGGWNVLALLVLLLLQAGLGLFAVDVEGLESGSLARFVSFEAGRQVAAIHASLFDLLLLLIAVHVAAVLVHLLHWRENLVTPMLTGIKRVSRASNETLEFGKPWRALIGLIVSVLLGVGLATL
jgi:cytochrome b